MSATVEVLTKAPIEIRELREAGPDGGTLMGYFCKGHIDRHDFQEAANAYSGASEFYDLRHVRAADAHHVWWRCLPSGEGTTAFHPAEPHTRGAFPATVCESVSARSFNRVTQEINERNRARAEGMAQGVTWAINTLDVEYPEAAKRLLQVWKAGAP